MTETLARISMRFASELSDLVHAIEAGEDVERRIAVVREYAKTWLAVAELPRDTNVERTTG